ncbi:MAG: RDD family protein [Dehalococcoidia bacterium]
MLSTGNEALAEQPAAAPATAPTRPVARMNARISAYVIDSVVLVAFILVFFVISSSILLFTSDFGEGDPPDWAYYAWVSVFVGGTLLSWSLFNLAIMRWRGQSTGMYVVGIRAVSDRPLTLGRHLLRWFGLHPLLFHPLLLPVWAIMSFMLVSLTLSQAVLAVTLMLVLVCIAAPVAALLALLLDSDRRALHDRLAGTHVVYLNEP